MSYLAIADADRIHQYVFETRELRLIRGASLLQVRCSELLARFARRGGKVLRQDGGTVVASFDRPELASQFETVARRIYSDRTHRATVTTATAPCPPGSFDQSYKLLTGKLEAAKNSRDESGVNSFCSFLSVCEACGTLPAAALRAGPAFRRARLCQACLLRDAKGDSRSNRRWRGDHSPPPDFEWLGARATPANYLAIVYIDCDRLGRYVGENIGPEPDSLRELSFAIASAVEDSVRGACKAIEPVLENHTETDCYQVLLVGGDDALLALPANEAFGFIERFQHEFDRFRIFRIGTRSLPRPTFSAGVAIAHSHFPIAASVKLAEQLLRSAKNFSGPGRKTTDSLDYEIVTASMAAAVEERETNRHTMRPYAIPEFARFLQSLRRIRLDVPRTKLNALYRIAHESKLQGHYDYLDLLSRLEPCQRVLLMNTVGRELWQEDRTRAADAAEVLEFL